jgi:hypothetical protein
MAPVIRIRLAQRRACGVVPRPAMVVELRTLTVEKIGRLRTLRSAPGEVSPRGAP